MSKHLEHSNRSFARGKSNVRDGAVTLGGHWWGCTGWNSSLSGMAVNDASWFGDEMGGIFRRFTSGQRYQRCFVNRTFIFDNDLLHSTYMIRELYIIHFILILIVII